MGISKTSLTSSVTKEVKAEKKLDDTSVQSSACESAIFLRIDRRRRDLLLNKSKQASGPTNKESLSRFCYLTTANRITTEDRLRHLALTDDERLGEAEKSLNTRATLASRPNNVKKADSTKEEKANKMDF